MRDKRRMKEVVTIATGLSSLISNIGHGPRNYCI